MQLLTTNVLAAAAQHLPITEALSGIFGSISLTAWICLLVRFSPAHIAPLRSPKPEP
jgi:hypothetical protein